MSLNNIFLSAVNFLQKKDTTKKQQPLVGTFKKAPQKPNILPECDTSIIFGKSAYQAETECKERYKPVESGGFELADSDNLLEFNRAIVHGRNKLLTGDRPIFKTVTTTGSGVYDGSSPDKSYPLFPREKAELAKEEPCLGILKISVLNKNGKKEYLHELKSIKALFMPGYTRYKLKGEDKDWELELTIAPTLNYHGYVISLKSDHALDYEMEFGDIYWRSEETNRNELLIKKNAVKFKEKNLPNGHVLAGVSVDCSILSKESDFGDKAIFKTRTPQKEVYFYSVWGVDKYEEELASEMMNRLNTTVGRKWTSTLKKLQSDWFDCYIGKALKPAVKFQDLSKNPELALKQSLDHWNTRLNEFQIKTPDPYLNAAVNFQRCISDYHRMGPGLVLSADMWIMYSHISVGWYGKLWAGDVETVKEHLTFLAAMQRKDGYIQWISPSLSPYKAENNTPYWVEQIWWVYAWSGDLQFLEDMWPLVQKAVNYEQKINDPDYDGLYQSEYEYWNCDSNGKGPKAATPTITAWAMYHSASKMAEALGKKNSASKYFAKSQKIKNAAMEELWDERHGILGSKGRDEILRTHPQIWEEYLGIITGMLSIDKGQRAMRYLESHYGFDGDDGVKLLLNCDWWPLRWSMHWVPVGDSLLAVMAGMKCGDADLWKPYMETVVRSCFRRYSPALGFGISNTGSAGGDIEDVDAVDPHSHMTVRGLFGITPELHNNTIHIAPGFPSDWENAEIKTPFIAYSYTKKNGQIEFKITTPEPVVKVITPYFGAPQSRTKPENETVIVFDAPEKSSRSNTRRTSAVKAIFNRVQNPNELTFEEVERLENFDLSKYYNTTLSKLTHKTKFLTDFSKPTTIKHWWHTVPAHMTSGDETIELKNGLSFLLKNRNKSVEGKCNGMLALSSWGKPYPFPGSVDFKVNKNLKAFWLMLQNYVSPIKNYIPNGEIVLKYSEGKKEIISLIPPYNLDCYFQGFSQEGISVELGELEWGTEWTPCNKEYCKCQANILKVPCDPQRVLESFEVRATVSEGVIGINAITILPEKNTKGARQNLSS